MHSICKGARASHGRFADHARQTSDGFDAEDARPWQFLRELNTERPHEALDMKRPADVHTPSRKPFTGLADLTRGGTRRFATFHSACHRATTFLEPRGEGTGTYGLPDAPRGSLRAARRDRI